METKRETAVITLRIEKELLERIDIDAKNEHRSRTGQIIHMVTQFYKTKEQFTK